MTCEPFSHAPLAGDQVVTPRSAMPLGPILLRAGIVALLLGSVLTLANQTAALFDAARLEVVPLVLVYLTPFVVVAVSQILGFRQASLEFSEPGSSRNPMTSFWATVAGHGIPIRAALLGLIAGSANASITIASSAGDALPLALIAQAYALPTLFSALSQALSYRRARTARADSSPA